MGTMHTVNVAMTSNVVKGNFRIILRQYFCFERRYAKIAQFAVFRPAKRQKIAATLHFILAENISSMRI
jgi:hypothetical protein